MVVEFLDLGFRLSVPWSTAKSKQEGQYVMPPVPGVLLHVHFVIQNEDDRFDADNKELQIHMRTPGVPHGPFSDCPY